MEDRAIIELYFERDERAIEETDHKYGVLCQRIAHNILGDAEDAKECTNDTYMKTWDSIPPKRPEVFQAWICKVVRNISIDKWRFQTRQKRGAGNVNVVLDELSECIPDAKSSVHETYEQHELTNLINTFLLSQTTQKRVLFVQRYFYNELITEIADRYDMSESKVKSILFRTRKELRVYLEKEGVSL